MLILIILFLFLFLLVSIVICRDNKFCIQILSLGYLLLIALFLFLAYKTNLTLDNMNLGTLRLLITSEGNVDIIEENSINDQNAGVQARLDPIEVEDLLEDSVEMKNVARL